MHAIDNDLVDVILVEDNPDDAILTKRALKAHQLGNNILHLKNGEEAIHFIFSEGIYEGKKFGKPPKLILLDLKMPKVNGLEVLKRLKTTPGVRKIPVVILTSSFEDADIHTCYDLGANSFVVKPVEFEEFMNAVGKLGIYWMEQNKSVPKI